MKLSSIQQRIVIATIFTTLLALLISSTAMVIYNLRDYRSTSATEILAQASLLSRAVAPALQFADPESAQAYLNLLEDQPRVIAAAVYTQTGDLFVDYNPAGDTPERTEGLPRARARLEGGSFVDGNSLVVLRRIIRNNEIIGYVFVRMQYTFLEKLAGNIAIAFGGIVVALASAIFISWQLQRSITQPLRSVAALARRFIETKDYSLRADKVKGGEVAYLVDAINAMLDEVEQRRLALEVTNRNLASEVQERRNTEKSLRESEENVLRLNSELEQRVKERTLQYEVANKELESFSYSVSHDLRSPLRAIDGFSQALLEDYEEKLDETGKDYLVRVRAAAQRMGELIDDMLKLSRVSRGDMNYQEIDLSWMAQQVLQELRDADPHSEVQFSVASGINVVCDPRLIRIALTNLLGNAWKYSSKVESPHIEFGSYDLHGETIYFVRDNGVGFDMAYADKLFGAFQRLHASNQFKGTGIGLATAKRVITRHGGRIWADAKPGEGATFSFTLPKHEIHPPISEESESAAASNTDSSPAIKDAAERSPEMQPPDIQLADIQLSKVELPETESPVLSVEPDGNKPPQGDNNKPTGGVDDEYKAHSSSGR